MATTPRESKTLEHVRRWRKEAYEERSRMTPEELVRHDREVAERLGLADLPVASTVQAKTAKKAG